MNQFNKNYQNEYEAERKKFHHAYVLKPSFNFAPLRKYADKLIYASEGYGNDPDILRAELEKSLSNFNEETDVLIPVGSAVINFLAGTILQRKITERVKVRPSYALGIWFREESDKDEWVPGQYVFWRVHLDGETESYEIIQ